MAEDSPISGKSLTELQFRQTYGANVPTWWVSTGARNKSLPLIRIVIGKADVVRNLKDKTLLQQQPKDTRNK